MNGRKINPSPFSPIFNHVTMIKNLLPILIVLLLQSPVALAEEWQPFLGDQGASIGVNEPSGVCQLEDGRIFLVQDEAKDPFVLLALDGMKLASPIRPQLDVEPATWTFGENGRTKKLADLEGITCSAGNSVYAITSHSRTPSGKRHKSREKLVRLLIDEATITEFSVVKQLRTAIFNAYPLLKPYGNNSNTKGRMEFNIEGLCLDKSGKHLLLGLRSPVIDGDSFILMLENPEEIFSSGSEPRFTVPPFRLKLNKGGIRAMSYIPELNGYFLATQRARKSKKSKSPFELWFWSGSVSEQARQIKLSGVSQHKTEGLAQISHGGRNYLIMVSDEGNRGAGYPGYYLITPLDKIKRLLADH